jgi:hypothetical protein
MVGEATETMSDGDSRMEYSADEQNHYVEWCCRDYDCRREQDGMLCR